MSETESGWRLCIRRQSRVQHYFNSIPVAGGYATSLCGKKENVDALKRIDSPRCAGCRKLLYKQQAAVQKAEKVAA